MEDFEYKRENGILIKISGKKIEKLIKELEIKIYNEGLYHKMGGSWDISVEFDEDRTDETFEELEEGEDWRLMFKVTARCYEEDGGHSDWWSIYVDVDKKLNIKKCEVV